MPDESRFLSAAAGLAAAGCVIAVVVSIVTAQSAAFRGSLSASGVLGVVFAAQNVRLLRRRGRPAVAAATVTTVFGGWFMIAPLLYDPGFVATAGVQFAGLLTASFAGYMTVAAIAD